MLPLFPLNTVLCPGNTIALHIFEERYKQMIRECRSTDGNFGVVLISDGQEALGPVAEPCAIGCTASIARTQSLPEGRLNLVAQGTGRFRIHGLNHEKPFLQGEVEILPMPTGPEAEIASASSELSERVEGYRALVERMGEKATGLRTLPEDPVGLAYRVLSVLNVPLPVKQTLLSTQDALELITETDKLYRNQTILLQALLECRAHPDRCHWN